MSLLSHHAALIEASAISNEVAEGRGYRSIQTKAELESLGFSKRQRRVPALLIPIRDVTGEIATYLLRPDHPRIAGERALKYELPSGARMVLDVPANARGDIDDPSVPLFITEGARKADAAVSMGLCCVSLIGTWAWRGSNAKGGKVVLADFESIACNGREVYIAFDSDVMVKESVHLAMERLEPVLQQRGAKVRFIYLPAGAKGDKVGLDDFIAAGHGIDELMARASTELRPIDDGSAGHETYAATNDGIFWRKPTKGGHDNVRLTNFSARIVADTVRDDGLEEERLLEIEASLHGRETQFRIPASRFPSMNWVIDEVGAGATVEPGFALKDRARHAIQVLSGDPPVRRVYAHLGWRQIDGDWVYLHAGGAIGVGGVVEGVEVELTGALAQFELPAPPTGDELVEAVRASLSLAELGPDEITLPMLAAAYRAPLGESDFTVFLVGPTGQFKTAAGAICQQHWGAELDERNVPESFRSTPNAIEGLLFEAKDTLVLVDEFAPGGTQSEIDRSHRDADRVLRSQGNRAGRARMTPDGRLRPAKRPRGLTVVTGEDVPHGQSLRARLLVLEITPGAINVDILTELQEVASAGLLAKAMAGYVGHLARDRDQMASGLRAERDHLRRELSASGPHRRTPSLVADLLVGVRHLIAFATECRALTEAEGSEFEARARAALIAAAERQHRHQTDAEPTARFRELLGSALASGVAHVAAAEGSKPLDPLGWGWRETLIGTDMEWRPLGKRIGWLRGDDLFLDSGASLAAAQEVAGRTGAAISVGAETLRKRLHERGELRSHELEARGTLTVRRNLEGKRRAVLHVAARFLEPDRGPEAHTNAPDPPDPGDAESGAVGAGASGHVTTVATAPDPFSDAAERRSGQIGQVEAGGVWDFSGRAHPTTASSVDAARPTPNQGPPVDATDQPDQTLEDGDPLEAEIERVRQKFPDLFQEDE